MIAKRIAILTLALALFGPVTVSASGGNPQQVVVWNTTQTDVWVTMYEDAGPMGWSHRGIAGYSRPKYPWGRFRQSDGNGPYKVRFEVTSPNGKKYDVFTTFWYDGSQRRYNSAGDANTNLYVCQKDGVFFWSFRKDCSDNANTAGI